MCLQVNRKYNAVLDEIRRLKEYQSVLLTSLKGREERVKELEEKVKELEERFLTHGIDAKVSNHTLGMYVCSRILFYPLRLTAAYLIVVTV